MRPLQWRVLTLGGALFLLASCADGIAGNLGVPSRSRARTRPSVLAMQSATR